MDKMEMAELIALNIYSSRLFGVYGKGNFDLSLDEFKDLLTISMDEEAENRIETFYERIK